MDPINYFIPIFFVFFPEIISHRDLSSNRHCGCGVVIPEIEGLTFPWTIFLQVLRDEDTVQECLGTIISSNVILTNYECITETSGELIDIKNIDIETRDYNELKATGFSVSNTYPKFGYIVVEDDIILDTDSDRPVCIPTKDELQNFNIINANAKLQLLNGAISANNLTIMKGEKCGSLDSLQKKIDNVNDLLCIVVDKDEQILTIGDPIFVEMQKSNYPSYPYGYYVYLGGLIAHITQSDDGKVLYYFNPIHSLVESIETFVSSMGSTWCPQPYAWLSQPEKNLREKSLDCECGVRDLYDRKHHAVSHIVDAQPFEYLWNVKIYVETSTGKVFCGGAIINDWFILTSATCVAEHIIVSDPSKIYEFILGFQDDLKVVVYAHSYNTENTFDDVEIPIAEIFVHPAFVDGKKKNGVTQVDIALLVMKTPLDFTLTDTQKNPSYRPICLPNFGREKYLVGKMALVTGWDDTILQNSTEIGTSSLKVTDLEVQSIQSCKRKTNSDIPHAIVCGALKSADDLQLINVGNPVFMKTCARKYTLIGISSSVGENNQNNGQRSEYNFEAFFTDVQELITWVDYYASMFQTKYCQK